jgi:cytochrome c551/c552
MPNTSTLVMRLMRIMARQLTFLAITFALAGTSAGATGITLPPDVSKLRPSSLPGYAMALQKCGICHSADYISYQPPGLSQAQWTAEMNKMQHAYGAPLDPGEVALIGAYLAVASGSAKVSDDSVVALAARHKAEEQALLSKPTAGSGAIDVQALLTTSACPSCHALQKAVVSPAFSAVAAKYKADATAPALLAKSIRLGGVGKWGQVAMPPMAQLSEEQIGALAAFALKQ